MPKGYKTSHLIDVLDPLAIVNLIDREEWNRRPVVSVKGWWGEWYDIWFDGNCENQTIH